MAALLLGGMTASLSLALMSGPKNEAGEEELGGAKLAVFATGAAIGIFGGISALVGGISADHQIAPRSFR